MPPSDPEAAKASDNPADRPALVRTMSENFTGVYLTMLSIIQGVALTDLSNIVFSERSHFTVLTWIEVATMLWTLIYVWNHFMGDALMTHWIPDLEDAVLLFGTGVFELVANHAIVWSITAWVATIAIMLFAWFFGTHYIRRQEERVVREAGLMELLRRRIRPITVETLAGGVVLLLLAIVCAVTHAGWQSDSGVSRAVALVSVLASFGVSLAIGVTSAAYWRAIKEYARHGR
jgi:hypothetical protein